MATVNEKRNSVIKQYDTIIGRNYYDQSKRAYVFTKYKDGKYYSDCSSSICYSYSKAGIKCGNYNTAGLYNSKDWDFVDVPIKNGQITDTSKLRVGDILLYRGNDSSRPKYIGHVEMVHTIKGDTITICGHGSGRPSKKDLKDYNRKRYNTKGKNPVGNQGLVCVKRLITDVSFDYTGWVKRVQKAINVGVDGKVGPKTLNGCPVLLRGRKGTLVRLVQERLDNLGYNVNGIDGVFGGGMLQAVKQYQKDNKLDTDGKIGPKTWGKLLKK